MLSNTVLVGKQRVVLENQTDIALVDRDVVDAPASDVDVARCRLHQPGDGPQDGGFAAAGWTEKGDEGAPRKVRG